MYNAHTIRLRISHLDFMNRMEKSFDFQIVTR